MPLYSQRLRSETRKASACSRQRKRSIGADVGAAGLSRLRLVVPRGAQAAPDRARAEGNGRERAFWACSTRVKVDAVVSRLARLAVFAHGPSGGAFKHVSEGSALGNVPAEGLVEGGRSIEHTFESRDAGDCEKADMQLCVCVCWGK